MPEIEINDLGTIGLIQDIPGFQLPPEAWTTALNVQCIDGAMTKAKGWAQVFGTPGVAPHYALNVLGVTGTFWLYVSLLKAFAYDGVSHVDITRAAGDYTAVNTRDWNGTIIGGIPILNNGTDVPQFWALPYNTATDLAAMTNWPATHRAKVFRALGQFLFAINITKGATVFPHMIKWSHPTVPGSLPASWDETDPSKDVREVELSDINSGVLLDMLPLRGRMVFYKEGSTWVARFVGGRKIFSVDTLFETSGLLTERCAALLNDGQRQVVLSQDDLIIHDGNTVTSIADRKVRKSLFNSIDVTNYRNTFVYVDPETDLVKVCYPETGQTQPSKALVWNYREAGRGGAYSEEQIAFRNVGIGTVETSDTAVWDDDTGVWDADTSTWSQSSRRKVILLDTANSKFHQANTGEARDGVAFTAQLSREGLALIGRKRNGEPIVDHKQFKLTKRLWLKITGSPVSVRLGAQQLVNGSVTWAPAQVFDPSTQMYLDFEVCGRAIAIEISSTTALPWRIEGYKIDLELVGEH